MLSHSRIEKLAFGWATLGLAKRQVLALSLQWGYIQPFPPEVPSRQPRRVHTNPLSYVPYLILKKCSCIHSPAYSGNAGLCQHSSTLQEQLVNSSLALGFPGRRRFLGHSTLNQEFSGLNQALDIQVSQTQGTHFKVVQVPLETSFRQAYN